MKMILILLITSALLIAGCTSNTKISDSTVKAGTDNSMNKSDEKNTLMNKTTEIQNNGTNKSKMGQASEGGYRPFEKAAYDEARAEGKIIFLEFYANWCPTCAAQAPALEEAFKEIKSQNKENVVGFRVNYKDSDTDSDEDALAKEFGIAYQHTHIILDSKGKVAKRSNEQWSADQIEEEISKVT
ncbi:TlpA family protein disulfide reductase [Candidatus Micrarchaeota archaeon]|nr:TlpA family protein disulfide reductase [Candidatus Micrarchaeota archaeon]